MSEFKFRENKTEDLINNKKIIEERISFYFIIHEYDEEIIFSRVKEKDEFEKVWNKLIKESKNKNYMGYYVPLIYKIKSIKKKEYTKGFNQVFSFRYNIFDILKYLKKDCEKKDKEERKEKRILNEEYEERDRFMEKLKWVRFYEERERSRLLRIENEK
tara:strand:+ start:76 stop:552 length:477 start_codon:yes stop_codon:yes gene_type:complete